MAKELNEQSFELELKDVKKALVDFWAPWCGPCRAQAPILDKLDPELVTVFKVNVDQNPSLAMRFNISSIPTLLVFEHGKLVRSSVGLHNQEQLLKLIG